MADFTTDANGNFHVPGRKGTYTIPFVFAPDAPAAIFTADGRTYNYYGPEGGSFSAALNYETPYLQVSCSTKGADASAPTTVYGHIGEAVHGSATYQGASFYTTDGNLYDGTFAVSIKTDGPAYTGSQSLPVQLQPGTTQRKALKDYQPPITGASGHACSGTATITILQDIYDDRTHVDVFGQVLTAYYVSMRCSTTLTSFETAEVHPLYLGAIGYDGAVGFLIDFVPLPCDLGVTVSMKAGPNPGSPVGDYYDPSAYADVTGPHTKPPYSYEWTVTGPTFDSFTGNGSPGIQINNSNAPFPYPPPGPVTATVKVTDSSSPPCTATGTATLTPPGYGPPSPPPPPGPPKPQVPVPSAFLALDAHRRPLARPRQSHGRRGQHRHRRSGVLLERRRPLVCQIGD